MFIDLNGKIKNTSLLKSQSLFPLFEAVINSFQSIEYLDNKTNSYIKIVLEKDADNRLVKSIIIEDNGIGFNNSNFKSFSTSDSIYKSLKGCMGIGRFKWLKAFENVKIESRYITENRIFFRRSFTFNLYNRNFINELINDKCKEDTFKTVIYLENLKNNYKDHFPQNIDEIGLKIIKHCLPYFIYRKNIKVTLSDGENTISLNDMFVNSMKLGNNIIKFPISDSEFEILHVSNNSDEESMNTLSLCANNREVKTFDLSKYIKDLSSKIKLEGKEEFYYHGYVYGNILDKGVNTERTGFNLDEDGISLEDIINGSIKVIKNFLKKYLDSVSASKIERTIKYINEKAPQFKPLLKNNCDEFEKFDFEITDEELETKLYKLSQDLNIKLDEINDNADVDETEKFEEESDESLEKDIELKSTLVKYIAHRKKVLDSLKDALNVDEDGTYALSKYIQKIIFPIRNKLDEITHEKHNLWIIDDKLTFHSYLGCNDSSLITHKDIEEDDLLVINNPIAIINEDQKPYCSLSIVYFNRPMRTNYESLNPIDEIQKYIMDLRYGKQIDRTGRIITLTDNAIINVYLVCDLNYEFVELLETRDFQSTKDKLEYTLFHKNLNCFIKVISYDKMLQEANMRNEILFNNLFF